MILLAEHATLSTHRVRSWAVDQLHQIENTLGVRQAGMLAKAASTTLSKANLAHVMECLEIA